jgi:hypothetical protein
MIRSSTRLDSLRTSLRNSLWGFLIAVGLTKNQVFSALRTDYAFLLSALEDKQA